MDVGKLVCWTICVTEHRVGLVPFPYAIDVQDEKIDEKADEKAGDDKEKILNIVAKRRVWDERSMKSRKKGENFKISHSIPISFFRDVLLKYY